MEPSLQGKKVLVTGAFGFIGSHLSRSLLKEGAEVYALVRKESSQDRVKDIIEDIKVYFGDIRDYSAVSSCVKDSKPQIIFHLAALRDVRRDLELVNAVIDVNIKGLVNLVNAAVKGKISLECFINTGTCEEYGDLTVPFSEGRRESPVSPYSFSKVSATYFSQMVFKTEGLPMVTLRPFLTYGPFQDRDMFIPSLISHCLEGRDFKMTRGDQTREFNYVDDIVDAYLRAAVCKEAIGEVINIGNGIEYRIRSVAEKILDYMGRPVNLLIGKLDKRIGEPEHFFCRNDKAKRILNWLPKVSLDRGLQKTINWYKNYSS